MNDRKAPYVAHWALTHCPGRGVISATDRLVLLCLVLHADCNGENAYPSANTIADEIDAHLVTVRVSLRTLRRQGLIEQTGWCTRPTKGGPQQVPVYRIVTDEGGSDSLQGVVNGSGGSDSLQGVADGKGGSDSHEGGSDSLQRGRANRFRHKEDQPVTNPRPALAREAPVENSTPQPPHPGLLGVQEPRTKPKAPPPPLVVAVARAWEEETGRPPSPIDLEWLHTIPYTCQRLTPEIAVEECRRVVGNYRAKGQSVRTLKVMAGPWSKVDLDLADQGVTVRRENGSALWRPGSMSEMVDQQLRRYQLARHSA